MPGGVHISATKVRRQKFMFEGGTNALVQGQTWSVVTHLGRSVHVHL